MKNRKAMIAPNKKLSRVKQCKLAKVSRSTFYYEATKISDEELSLMRAIDKVHMKFPFYGSRKIVFALGVEEIHVNRKRVRRLMRVMGIESMAPKPNLSKPTKENVIFPYLLRGVAVTKAHQVWATDITYIPLEKGFIYLVAVIDWYSRKVLSFRLSNTMDSDFCVEALEEALEKYGRPEIFNTDQGAQFTSKAFTEVLKKNGIRISMDGKGRCLDNVFVERLWRSLKYEDVYLRKYSTMSEAVKGISRYFKFFNSVRPHQTFNNKTPDAIFEASLQNKNSQEESRKSEGHIGPINDKAEATETQVGLKKDTQGEEQMSTKPREIEEKLSEIGEERKSLLALHSRMKKRLKSTAKKWTQRDKQVLGNEQMQGAGVYVSG